MKTFIIETAVVLALLFIVYRGIFMVLSSRIEAAARESAFYVHAGVLGFPFAVATAFVLPHLTTALNFYSRSNEWGKLIQFGGGYLVVIILSGVLAIVLSFTIFKIITKEKSVWQLVSSGSASVTYLLSSILVSAGVIVAVLAGEIGKELIPFSSVPFSY